MSTVYARSTVPAVYSAVLHPSLMVFFLFNLRSPWTWDTFHRCQQSHNKVYQSQKIWLFSKRKRRSLAKLATRTILLQDALLLNFQLTSSKTFNWHDKHFLFFKNNFLSMLKESQKLSYALFFTFNWHQELFPSLWTCYKVSQTKLV